MTKGKKVAGLYLRPDGIYEKIITIDGKRYPFRSKDPKEVMRKIMEYQKQVEHGKPFKDIAEEWKSEHWKTLSPNSTRNYNPAYERAVSHFGTELIKNIKPNDINSFIIDFSRCGYAQKTCKTQLLILHLIFSNCVVSGDLEYNPAQYVQIPKNLAKNTRAIPSDEQIEKVKKSFGCQFGLFAYFLLYTGCRRGEALAVKFKDIDRKENIIRIYKSVYNVKNKPNIKEPKTKAGKRNIILRSKLLEQLPKGNPDDYLFSNESGGLLSETQFQRQWELYQKASGVTVTPHQLRHAYASMAFEAGLDEKDLQDQLGHASIAMSKDIYTHIRDSRRNKTAELFEEYDRTQ